MAIEHGIRELTEEQWGRITQFARIITILQVAQEEEQLIKDILFDKPKRGNKFSLE